MTDRSFGGNGPLTKEYLRSLIADRVGNFASLHQNMPGYKAPPPQLIEAMVDIETGGTYDPELISPSGAVGLGQIMPEGLEYGVYKSTHPDLSPEDLYDPKTNLDIMITGLSHRQAQGELGYFSGENHGSWEDWYMSAAGYLGGADLSGFNDNTDYYGTSGKDYVRRVRRYIIDTWGKATADDIDLLQRGAAVAENDDWINGEITYDPNAPERDERYLIDKVFSVFGKAIDAGTGVATSAAGEIIDGLIGFIAPALPRIFAAVAGLALFGIGAVVLLKGGKLG